MINRERWKAENIVRGISRIPIQRAHFLVWFAMLGGVVALVGMLWSARTLRTSPIAVPESIGLTVSGFVAFNLLFPLPYIIYLAKELQKTKDRLAELESKVGMRRP